MPLIDSKDSGVNTVRLRLLSGTHSLNSMMSRITRTTIERNADCPMCGNGPETVEHFLRTCPSTSAEREAHEEGLSQRAEFATLDTLGQCGFILACKVDGIGPSEADEAKNQELVSALWVRRSQALTAEASASREVAAPSPQRVAQRSLREFFKARPRVEFNIDQDRVRDQEDGRDGEGQGEGMAAQGVQEGDEMVMVDGQVFGRGNKSSCDLPRVSLPVDVARPARGEEAHGEPAMPR